MLKAVIDAETLRGAIEAASPLVTEARLTISDRGLELRAIDPASVAMVSLSGSTPPRSSPSRHPLERSESIGCA
ncbi:MAG: hypothetical protein QHG98_08675 [Methanothrix sp.]|uniref:hypothetical protein n=1 Tax=Methanothrix sp. TaxID=90426 RepID=UPI00247C1DC3|nr:hypothetical protein [Methanothrix sp.]